MALITALAAGVGACAPAGLPTEASRVAHGEVVRRDGSTAAEPRVVSADSASRPRPSGTSQTPIWW